MALPRGAAVQPRMSSEEPSVHDVIGFRIKYVEKAMTFQSDQLRINLPFPVFCRKVIFTPIEAYFLLNTIILRLTVLLQAMLHVSL